MTRNCTAVIGDVVKSRSLDPRAREKLHVAFEALMDRLNVELGDAILSGFTITIGDEFQGLLTRPEILPKLLWELEDALEGVQVRVGVGFGALGTPLKERAIGMDGPVFHQARSAIEQAKEKDLLGGVFRGFGAWEDRVLNGFARLLWYERDQWTPRQRAVARDLRDGAHPKEIADRLGVTRPAVYSRARTAGWSVYTEAEDGWRAMLQRYDTTEVWGGT